MVKVALQTDVRRLGNILLHFDDHDSIRAHMIGEGFSQAI